MEQVRVGVMDGALDKLNNEQKETVYKMIGNAKKSFANNAKKIHGADCISILKELKDKPKYLKHWEGDTVLLPVVRFVSKNHKPIVRTIEIAQWKNSEGMYLHCCHGWKETRSKALATRFR